MDLLQNSKIKIYAGGAIKLSSSNLFRPYFIEKGIWGLMEGSLSEVIGN